MLVPILLILLCGFSTTADADVTYVKDVAPILSQKCVLCHSPGGVAPWSMDNYEKVRGWSSMIHEVVQNNRMPPWHADPRYGKFRDDISLSPAQKDKILRWVETGMARGTGRDVLLECKQPNRKEWDLGQPDAIFHFKNKQEIPAAGQDFFVEVEAEQPMPDDVWITAFEIKPGNVRVVHHANIVVEQPQVPSDISLAVMPSQSAAKEKLFKDSGLSMEGGQVIAGYSPGMGGVKLPKETGIFVPKGSRIIFRMHYVTTGKLEEDLSRVGFYIQKRKPKKVLSVAVMHNRDIAIPAGEKNYERQATYTFNEDVLLTMLQPHMHYRGKAMRFTAVYPDGRSEILLSVPNYQFTWQRQYVFVNPSRIPAGTRIVLDGSYDNSLDNPFNRAPLREVSYGPGSDQEMFTGIMFYIKDRK
jgi:hypothetical protein